MDAFLEKYLGNNSGIEEILPDNKLWKNRFNVKSSSSNRLYVIAQNKASEEWKCSCPGNIRWGKCAHLTAVLPLINRAKQAEELNN